MTMKNQTDDKKFKMAITIKRTANIQNDDKNTFKRRYKIKMDVKKI